MPIYAYQCASCGHTKDVLQKISDAPLTVCPACGAAAFTKQVTAAGFQLKGSGWYVTDFRPSNKAEPAKPAESSVATEGTTPAEKTPTPDAQPTAAPHSSAQTSKPAADSVKPA